MSQTIDQQFIEYIVKSLVSNPDAVVVDRRVDEKGVLLELHVDSVDLGRVIGKRGATAQSLRILLRALGTKQDARLNLKIIDPSEGEPRNNDFASSEHRDDHQDNHVDEKSEVEDVQEPEPKTDSEPDEQVIPDASEDRFKKTREELAEFDDLDV
ncbi:MAG TPA: KH domain-containing protein [Candidatus Saccharimonadia bacterium]|nr:KH domain-containing protein [Candidatus Saccharimonadia bacterium]